MAVEILHCERLGRLQSEAEDNGFRLVECADYFLLSSDELEHEETCETMADIESALAEMIHWRYHGVI